MMKTRWFWKPVGRTYFLRRCSAGARAGVGGDTERFAGSTR